MFLLLRESSSSSEDGQVEAEMIKYLIQSYGRARQGQNQKVCPDVPHPTSSCHYLLPSTLLLSATFYLNLWLEQVVVIL